MGSWRTLAETIRQGGEGEHNRHVRHESSEAAPIAPIVPNVPANPARDLRLWHAKLSRLDDCNAPEGCKAWWQQACDDSFWIYENFAGQAVRDGWSANDLFGILPWHPGWGGLACRLRGARNLKMEGPKAVWSRFGVTDWTCRGAGDDLVCSGLKLIWEFQ